MAKTRGTSQNLPTKNSKMKVSNNNESSNVTATVKMLTYKLIKISTAEEKKHPHQNLNLTKQ